MMEITIHHDEGRVVVEKNRLGSEKFSGEKAEPFPRRSV